MSARAGLAGEKAEEMPRHVVKPRSPRQLALDVRNIGFDRREGVGDRRRRAEQDRIDADQQFWRLIGGAADHHAIDIAQKLGRRGQDRGRRR